MRDQVEFELNGKPQSVHAPDPNLTVLEWLRERQRMTGTKEGCAEGDCGACTVAIVDSDGAVRAINACIAFVPTLDGKAVYTVEGLRGIESELHPVQRAMIDEHGSQCGFCTPGIVMALAVHHARTFGDAAAASNEAVSRALSGNLCRCTGYAPILRAGARALDDKAPTLRPAREPDESLGYTTVSRIDGSLRAYFAPRSLEELDRILIDHPAPVFLAGGTDVGLWVTKHHRELEIVISTQSIAELRSVEESDDHFLLGAAVTYHDASSMLAALHPALLSYLHRIGGVQVRDSGTIGGNIANGSPIGDMPPLLIALGATILLRRAGECREIPLEDFFVSYGKQDRAPDELLTHIRVPKVPAHALVAAEKISKRFDQDISAVAAGFLVEVADGQVTNARLAFGGMAGTPARAHHAESALLGATWSAEVAERAAAQLELDFEPLSDLRASARYRLEAAGALIRRFQAESKSSERLSSLRSLAS